jgi:hypothetical protein
LDIVILGGGCDGFRHLAASQTSRDVRITAVGSRWYSPGILCTADLHVYRDQLTLGSPLAGRHLVHARVSSGWHLADYKRIIRQEAGSTLEPPTGR